MSNTLSITVLKSGLFTTIQDQGRTGYQRFGVPFSGPMSKANAELANRLVGKEVNFPTIEITLVGPQLLLKGKGCIAVTGAPIEIFLDQKKMEMNKSLTIDGECNLSFGKMESGYRSYLSIRGQWDLEPWLGSVSAAPGNTQDVTPASRLSKNQQFLVYSDDMYSIQYDHLPFEPASSVRIMAGPEYNNFEAEQIRFLLSQAFEVSPQANRMGLRLLQKLPNYKAQTEVISSGIVPGTIQITNEGQPIILTADAQTSGGYPRIANVLSDDFNHLAQLRPRDRIKFQLTSITDVLSNQHHA